MAKQRKPNFQQMFAAIRRRDIKLLQDLLGEGADPNAATDEAYVRNFSILNCAAGAQWTEGVELLLKSGANPNTRATAGIGGEGAGETALHSALAGEDTRPGDIQRSTDEDRLRIVEMLLSAGADPNAVKDGDRLPLHYAARRGNWEICQRLVQAGATFRTWPAGCMPPLLGAVTVAPEVEEGRSQEHIAEWLLGLGAPVDGENAKGYTALLAAAHCGSERLVNLFLERGADVNHRMQDGRTPFLCVAEYARFPHSKGEQQRAIRVFKRLLQAGADPNARNNAGESAYDIVSRSEAPLAAEYLKQFSSGGAG